MLDLRQPHPPLSRGPVLVGLRLTGITHDTDTLGMAHAAPNRLADSEADGSHCGPDTIADEGEITQGPWWVILARAV
jgi:hypothetical protein